MGSHETAQRCVRPAVEKRLDRPGQPCAADRGGHPSRRGLFAIAALYSLQMLLQPFAAEPQAARHLAIEDQEFGDLERADLCPIEPPIGAVRRYRAQDGFPLHSSEEHTSELQSLMRISYAVFCL